MDHKFSIIGTRERDLNPIFFHVDDPKIHIKSLRRVCYLESRFNNQRGLYTIYDSEGKRIWWRTYGPPSPHKQFTKNYALRQLVKECTNEKGEVAIVRSGMDCDCSTFCDVSHVNANWYDVETYINEDQSWADGPVSYSLITPAEEAEFNPPPSRDLALEAFEDGHSHIVSEVRYENN